MDKHLERFKHLHVVYYQVHVYLAVTLWLSGVVVWENAYSLIDCRHINVFIHVLNFHIWGQPWYYFNSKFFPIYSIPDSTVILVSSPDQIFRGLIEK